MKTEKISKLIDNAEVIRGEICEGFSKRIEELYSSLKDKKMVFGWQDVVLPYPNEDDYETEEDYDEAMEHYEEYSEGIINFTWKNDYNYCLLGGLSFRIIDGEVIFTSVINKSDEESPEYWEDDYYYFNPYLSDNFKCCAQIIKTIEAVENNAFDCDKKTIMTEKIIEGIKYLLEEETLTAEVIKNPNSYRGNIIIPETIVFNEVTYRVTSVGKQAFGNCFSLTSVVIPNSVTSIGRDAFGGCDSLKSIVISNGVTSIGEAAFMECDSLKSITFNGTKMQWNSIELGDEWNCEIPAQIVRCTDGNVKIEDCD